MRGKGHLFGLPDSITVYASSRYHGCLCDGGRRREFKMEEWEGWILISRWSYKCGSCTGAMFFDLPVKVHS